MRGFAAGAIAILALALAPAAQATQRFAAPAGSGTECTQPSPCTLNEAALGAKAGDEVIVTAGTYSISSSVFTTALNVQIHGDTAGSMPKIVMTGPSPAFVITQTGASLSYVEIEVDANGGLGITCFSAKLDRLKVRVIGIGGAGIATYQDCVIRNSLIHVEGSSSAALRGAASGISKSSAIVRNVTAIASGSGSAGAVAEYNEGVPGEFTLELQNSIVQGGEADLKPEAGPKGPGNIVATHSNFDSSSPVGEAKVIDGGGNQTAPPLFVSTEGGDYREAAGSPTIDAGAPGELGSLDLGGGTRVLGKAPDIGAFEFVPPIGQLQSLAVRPGAFRAGNLAGAVSSRKKKATAPLGATVSYALSAAADVDFTVERRSAGRKAGTKCVKQTSANKGHKACAVFKLLKGGFSVSGIAGPNKFKFSGKLGGKSLKPGSYRLVGSAGGVVRKAAFKIVR